jgi:predicted porin
MKKSLIALAVLAAAGAASAQSSVTLFGIVDATALTSKSRPTAPSSRNKVVTLAVASATPTARWTLPSPTVRTRLWIVRQLLLLRRRPSHWVSRQ